MSTVNMTFTEGVQLAKHLSRLAKDTCDGLDEYMKTMPLPEGTDDTQRVTLSLWVHHYINGTCSFQSLLNIAKSMGLEKVFDEPTKELECDEQGNINIWETKE